jgi:hypothetical protein
MGEKVKRTYAGRTIEFEVNESSVPVRARSFCDPDDPLNRDKVVQKKCRKRIDTPDGSFRKRRGKLVRIPDEWVGKTVDPQTIRKRKSKKSQGRRFRRKAIR